MPIITTTVLPNGIAGGAYSETIQATKYNLHLSVTNATPTVLPDGTGIDDQGDVAWNDVLVLTYTIENTGDDDLAISGVTPTVVTPASGVTAVLSGSPSALVEPLDTTTFVITVTLSAGVPFEVLIDIASDADSPEDSYTFNITGVGIDQLFNNPVLEIYKWEPENTDLPDASMRLKADDQIDFGAAVAAAAGDIDELVTTAEWVIDFGRGTTAAYQTADTTTAAAADGDPVYSIYPEKTPTGSTAIKLLDSNATTHGTYKDAAGYAIGGNPVLSLVNGTDGLYYPCDSSDVQQTDNSNWLSTGKFWCAFLFRIRPGTDGSLRIPFRADGVPRLWIEFKQLDPVPDPDETAFIIELSSNPGDIGRSANEVRDGTNGNVMYGAIYFDGTNLHSWRNSTTRIDESAPITSLKALDATSPKIIGLDGAYPVDVQAWYQGDQDGSDIPKMIANLQGLVDDFASR